jgi:hypothetical protein
MACRTGCRTQNHITWGECLRASNLQLNAGDAKHTTKMPTKKWDAELNAYRSAREQGIQPAGTTMAKVRQAFEISEKTGKAFNAERPQDSIIV